MTTWTETPVGSGLMTLADDLNADVCPTTWQRSFARADISTRVILDVDVPAETEQPAAVIANDVAAQILYGIEPFERTDLWTLEQSARQENAGRILATRSANVSMPRVRSVEIDATTSIGAIDLLSSLSIHEPSLYRGRLLNDRGLVFDLRFFAVGVIHDIAADGWTAEISLDRSEPYEVLDPADYIWDTARWDRSLWN